MSGQLSNTASMILKAVPVAMFSFFVVTKLNVVQRDMGADEPRRPPRQTQAERQPQGQFFQEVRRVGKVLEESVREAVPENTRRRPPPVPDARRDPAEPPS